MKSATRSELQLLAQTLLRSHNIELGDDPRSEIEVAQQLGILVITVDQADVTEE